MGSPPRKGIADGSHGGFHARIQNCVDRSSTWNLTRLPVASRSGAGGTSLLPDVSRWGSEERGWHRFVLVRESFRSSCRGYRRPEAENDNNSPIPHGRSSVGLVNRPYQPATMCSDAGWSPFEGARRLFGTHRRFAVLWETRLFHGRRSRSGVKRFAIDIGECRGIASLMACSGNPVRERARRNHEIKSPDATGSTGSQSEAPGSRLRATSIS